MLRPYNSISYTLEDAAKLLGAEKKNFKELVFTGVTHKDSEVLPGDIFLAFPGASVHGGKFIASAPDAGAVGNVTTNCPVR